MTSSEHTGPANATARNERAELADLMLAVGPDAPTCSGDWTTSELAAHLVVRERRPDAALGIIVPLLAGYTDRVQSGIAHGSWAHLVEEVRGGPPRWSLQSLPRIDGATNTVEFFVHHEDVRRAVPGWEPRELSALATAQLWGALVRGSRLLARNSPVGIVLRPTDGPGPAGERRVKEGERSVTLTGPVGECVLAMFGRPTAGLTIEGDPADVAAFHAFPR